MEKNGTIIKLENSNNNKNVEFSRSFRKDYLNYIDNPELIKQSVLITNLLFQIILDLRDNMFHTTNTYLYSPDDKKNNQLKFNLWENEFINSEKNELKKVYKTSFFLKNRNKKLITEALTFLKNYKSETYTFINSKGLKITTSGGLIKDWYFFDKSGNFEITISLYWADKIVRLENGDWNNLRVDIIKEFSNNKQRFFVLWLLELKKYSGTSKNFKDILNEYDLNYSDVKELMRGFVAPIKMKLDNPEINDNWFSFRYFLDPKNNNNIKFIPYHIKPKEKIELDEISFKEMNKNNERHLKHLCNYKLKYIKRRHSLTNDNYILIKKLIETNLSQFETTYKVFLSDIKKKNKIAIDYTEKEFCDYFQKLYNPTI